MRSHAILMARRKEKQVGLMVEALHGYGARILNGIIHWIRTNPGWRIAFFDGERSELARLVLGVRSV